MLIDPLLPTAADGTKVVRAAAEAGTRVVVLTADRSLRASARRLGAAAALDKDATTSSCWPPCADPAAPTGDRTGDVGGGTAMIVAVTWCRVATPGSAGSRRPSRNGKDAGRQEDQ